MSKSIATSLVHDGVCDCCDGSDEEEVTSSHAPAAQGRAAQIVEVPADIAMHFAFVGNTSDVGAVAANNTHSLRDSKSPACPNTCLQQAEVFLKERRRLLGYYRRGLVSGIRQVF